MSFWRLPFDSIIRYKNIYPHFRRAQIPFSFWLPKAIAAPTPVSSLVHSSTLVTAGVYIIFRLSPIILYTTKLFFFICFFTIVIRRIIAALSFDLKEIIAFSTLRHIRIMFISLRLMNYEGAFFHLCTHALFKALIFICAGFLIHCSGVQDIRMISLLIKNPKIKFAFVYSVISIIGIPFLSGFCSKEFIIDHAYSNNISLLNLIFFLSVFFTSIYSLRLLSILSKNFNKKFEINYFYRTIRNAILRIIIFSLVSGSILQWMITFFFRVVILKLKIFLTRILFIRILFIIFFKIYSMKITIFYNLFFCFYFIKFKFLSNKKIYVILEKNWFWFFIEFLTQLDWSNKIYFQKHFFIAIFILLWVF